MTRKASWLHEATDHERGPTWRKPHVHFSDDLTRRNPVAGVVVREPWRLRHLFGAGRCLHAFGCDRNTSELTYLGPARTLGVGCALIVQHEEVTRRA